MITSFEKFKNLYACNKPEAKLDEITESYIKTVDKERANLKDRYICYGFTSKNEKAINTYCKNIEKIDKCLGDFRGLNHFDPKIIGIDNLKFIIACYSSNDIGKKKSIAVIGLEDDELKSFGLTTARINQENESIEKAIAANKVNHKLERAFTLFNDKDTQRFPYSSHASSDREQ